MSCRNQCWNQQDNWGNESARQGSGCRRTGCFTATVPVTVTYQITPDLYDERAIISQIPGNSGRSGESCGDNWSDPSCGCGC